MVKHMTFFKTVTVLSIILLTGCALSPQTVSFSPVIQVASASNQQLARSVSVTVNDNRNNPIIGTRGGIYRDTSVITPAANMVQSLQNSITNSLRILGYSVVNTNSDASLEVNISELKYTAFGERNITAIETIAAVRVICRIRDFVMNNEYRITDKQDVLKAPSASRNQQIINDTLSSALQGMFNDEKLLECINR